MMRLLLAGIIVVSCSAIALAQDRPQSPPAQNLLKTWAASGAWQVDLVRLVDGSLGCRLVTIHDGKKTGDLYLWGIRWRKEGLGATITDTKAEAIAGPSIQILIDGASIGTYQVDRRADGAAGSNVVADLPPSDNDKLFSLLGKGGKMQFVTNASTYSASLDGAQEALSNFRACTVEAGRLTASSTGPDENPPKK